jgi:hypothetical protein
MSTPITRPSGPAASDARKLSMPEPLPRSSTVSPGAMSARSRKWPTPANESIAAAGIRSSSPGG